MDNDILTAEEETDLLKVSVGWIAREDSRTFAQSTPCYRPEPALRKKFSFGCARPRISKGGENNDKREGCIRAMLEEGLGSFVTWNGSEAPLPSKFGKRWLFDKADLDSYVDRGRIGRPKTQHPLSLRVLLPIISQASTS